MDYLIKKSDGTAVSQGGTISKIKLPEQTGGDVVFTGDKRPLDLGDYFLVKAKEIDEDLSATKKRGETVTVTKPAVAKSAAEMAQENIWTLEAAVTPRRLRDSILTDDGKKWLDDQEKLIAVERGKL